MLVDFMNKHPELRSGKFSVSFTYKSAQALWNYVANQLNEIPGATKDWKQWWKCWQDLRSSTKAKNTLIKNHIKGTGGGPSSGQVLSEIDQNVLAIIGPTAVDGHKSIKESEAQFDWNDPDSWPYEYLENGEELDPPRSEFLSTASLQTDDDQNVTNTLTSQSSQLDNNELVIKAVIMNFQQNYEKKNTKKEKNQTNCCSTI